MEKEVQLKNSIDSTSTRNDPLTAILEDGGFIFTRTAPYAGSKSVL